MNTNNTDPNIPKETAPIDSAQEATTATTDQVNAPEADEQPEATSGESSSEESATEPVAESAGEATSEDAQG